MEKLLGVKISALNDEAGMDAEERLRTAIAGLDQGLSKASVVVLDETQMADVTPFGGRSRALSVREIEVLSCLRSGMSNKAIARKINITEATVKVHLKGLLRKIKASNRTQAALYAQAHGIGASDPEPEGLGQA